MRRLVIYIVQSIYKYNADKFAENRFATLKYRGHTEETLLIKRFRGIFVCNNRLYIYTTRN